MHPCPECQQPTDLPDLCADCAHIYAEHDRQEEALQSRTDALIDARRDTEYFGL